MTPSDAGAPEWIGVVSFEMELDKTNDPTGVKAVTAAREHPDGRITEVYLPTGARVENPPDPEPEGFRHVGLCGNRTWDDGAGMLEEYALMHRLYATTGEEPSWFTVDILEDYYDQWSEDDGARA